MGSFVTTINRRPDASKIINAGQRLRVAVVDEEDQGAIPKVCIFLNPLNKESSEAKMVSCRVTYPLLKYLIDQQYPGELGKTEYKVKDGTLVMDSEHDVDEERLAQLLRQFTTVQNVQ
jgi:hypothetical protein